MIYWELFWSFFQIGLFSIGGGHAAMPLIQNQVVDIHSWLTMPQFADIMTISEMTPGPIAINSATFVGIQTAGIPGAIISTLGCVFPSCIIVLTLAYIYNRFRGLSLIQGVLAGLRPAVVAMIAKAGVSILISAFFINGVISFAPENISFRMVLYFAAALVMLRKFKMNPILVMILCGLFETAAYAVLH